MINEVQISRRLQVNRPFPGGPGGSTTNEMFVMGITNTVGMSCWNSYASAYAGSGNITVSLEDTMQMVLTNAVVSSLGSPVFFSFVANLPYWPGSAWNRTVTPVSAEAPDPLWFVSVMFTNVFLPTSEYWSQTGQFIPVTNNAPPWETNVTSNYVLPHFGLSTTNWAQVVILDGNHVLDYVQLSGPDSARNINGELNDPNFTGGLFYMWSTNASAKNLSSSLPASGEINQILLSRGIAGVRDPADQWPNNDPSDLAEQEYFNSFWSSSTNTALTVVAPFTPTRTMYDYTLWQANDPLVHYQACDLNYIISRQDRVKCVQTLSPPS